MTLDADDVDRLRVELAWAEFARARRSGTAADLFEAVSGLRIVTARQWELAVGDARKLARHIGTTPDQHYAIETAASRRSHAWDLANHAFEITAEAIGELARNGDRASLSAQDLPRWPTTEARERQFWEGRLLEVD